MGKLDNTLIIYISGDNGTSAEGTLEGTPNQMTAYNGILDLPEAELMLYYDSWGSDKTYPHMSVAWSWAFDTPFKWTKQVASHFGGTRQGLAISWPGHIKDVGGIRHQFHHMIDIVPTILEATGIKAPEMVDGIKQKPIEGVSMAYTFDAANANAPSTRKTQYFEMIANRGIYHEGWYANTVPPVPPWVLNAKMPPIADYKWELYNLNEDFSQADDLAAKNPAKLKELQDLFMKEAEKYHVLPIDDRTIERIEDVDGLSRDRARDDVVAVVHVRENGFPAQLWLTEVGVVKQFSRDRQHHGDEDRPDEFRPARHDHPAAETRADELAHAHDRAGEIVDPPCERKDEK
jgi:arylsulfatase